MSDHAKLATTDDLRRLRIDLRGGMIGRVYTWRGEHWRVITRWGKGKRVVRNVLLERVEVCEAPAEGVAVAYTRPGEFCLTDDGLWWRLTGERVVRPFRGLRKRKGSTVV